MENAENSWLPPAMGLEKRTAYFPKVEEIIFHHPNETYVRKKNISNEVNDVAFQVGQESQTHRSNS